MNVLPLVLNLCYSQHDELAWLAHLVNWIELLFQLLILLDELLREERDV